MPIEVEFLSIFLFLVLWVSPTQLNIPKNKKVKMGRYLN